MGWKAARQHFHSIWWEEGAFNLEKRDETDGCPRELTSSEEQLGRYEGNENVGGKLRGC